jgi:hypothetical protein
MFEADDNAFAPHEVSEPLQIARNLARIYDQVLDEPLPGELQRLIERLSSADGERHSGQSSARELSRP